MNLPFLIRSLGNGPTNGTESSAQFIKVNWKPSFHLALSIAHARNSYIIYN
jgi:hypothetical protein